MTPLMVFAYNHPSQKAAIYAELDAQGLVTFAVHAAPDSPIRGTELFLRMMSAFGDDAKAILGAWTKGDKPSINIDEVNRLTGQGMPLEDAVQFAWTVTRAKKLGFAKIRVVAQEGLPGSFRRLEVMIEK
jgi:hypothetical protein